MGDMFCIELRGVTLCAVLIDDSAELFLTGQHRERISDLVWPALADHVGPKSIVACGFEWTFQE